MEKITTKHEAHQFLEEKGFSFTERLLIQNIFSQEYKNDYPFILISYCKGREPEYFSEKEQIKSLRFSSEKEVILANAIYENIKDNFNPNEFIQMLKFTFRILNVNNDWSN